MLKKKYFYQAEADDGMGTGTEGGGEASGESSLGDAGKRALQAERQRAKELEQEKKRVAKELEDLRKQFQENQKQQQELEKKYSKFEEIDPEELERLRKAKEEKEQEEAAFQERYLTEKQQREALQKQFQEEQKRAKSLQQEIEEQRLKFAVQNDWSRHGGEIDELAFENLIYPTLRKFVKQHPEGGYTIIDPENGSPRHSKLDTEQLMGMDELMDELSSKLMVEGHPALLVKPVAPRKLYGSYQGLPHPPNDLILAVSNRKLPR